MQRAILGFVPAFLAAAALASPARPAEVRVAAAATDLALGADELPRGCSIPDEPRRDASVDRLADEIRSAARAPLRVDLAIQDILTPSGPASVISLAVLEGDPRAVLAAVQGALAGRHDARRFGNAVLVLASAERSARTPLLGACFSRFTKLARARAEERVRAGDPRGAIDCLSTILELSPDDPRARVRSGEILAGNGPGDAALAREHFERAVAALEKSKPAARPEGLLLDARLGLSRLERSRGEFSAAEAAARRALDEATGDAEQARSGYELAAALAAASRVDEALAALEAALDAAARAGGEANDLARRARSDEAFMNFAAAPRFKALIERHGGGTEPR